MDSKTASNQLGYFLEHVSSLFVKQLDQILMEQLGIGYAQFKILRVLDDNEVIGQRQIADELGQTEASISRQIKLLQDDDLLQTRTDPHNRRQHLSRLTRKGQRFTLAAEELCTRYQQDIFEPLKPKEQQAMQQSLVRIHLQTHEPKAHLPKSYSDLLQNL